MWKRGAQIGEFAASLLELDKGAENLGAAASASKPRFYVKDEGRIIELTYFDLDKKLQRWTVATTDAKGFWVPYSSFWRAVYAKFFKPQ